MNAIPQAPHERLLPGAETAGRRLIRSWIEYGPKQLNHFEPQDFPTGPLQQVAGGVLTAMLHEGITDLAGLVVYFDEAPEGTRAALLECAQDFAPQPQDCAPLILKLQAYSNESKRQHLISELASPQGQEQPRRAEIIKQLGEIEAGGDTRKSNLRERAYALRFDPNETPPPDESCMMIGDIPIAARGNLTVIQGKSKVGKSAVVSAILAAAQRGNFTSIGDALCMSWSGDDTGAIVHLDTEQSRADWHGLVSRSVTRSGLPGVSDRLVSLPLVMFARSERLTILRESLRHEQEERGVIDAVIIDGIADLCKSPNDEAEALELVSKVHALSQEFNAAIYCVLHENPGTEQAKTRGHLGSELNRKAFANLRIDKDADTSISTIYGTDMRKRDIPKEQGFCFGWDEEAGMHTFQGRSAGLKASQKEAEAIAKGREEWTPIFEFSAGQRENSAVPALSPKEAAEIEREISGKEKLTKPDTMKKRMQKAESLGVLRKFDLLRWVLNDSGKIGKGAGK